MDARWRMLGWHTSGLAQLFGEKIRGTADRHK